MERSTGRLVSVRWQYYSKQSIDLLQSLTKYQWLFFCGNIKPNPQISMELQGTMNSQNNTEKEEQSWRIHTSQIQNLLWY